MDYPCILKHLNTCPSVSHETEDLFNFNIVSQYEPSYLLYYCHFLNLAETVSLPFSGQLKIKYKIILIVRKLE